MNIRELAARVGSAERQIRYLIAEGFVPPPRGSRAQPDYGDDHIHAIRRFLGLRAAGLPPSAIRVLGESGDALVFKLVDGVALSVDPRLVGRPLDVTAITDRLKTILKHLQGEDP